jgi:hypothetical protein
LERIQQAGSTEKEALVVNRDRPAECQIEDTMRFGNVIDWNDRDFGLLSEKGNKARSSFYELKAPKTSWSRSI